VDLSTTKKIQNFFVDNLCGMLKMSEIQAVFKKTY
jgi:hypothetical protein